MWGSIKCANYAVLNPHILEFYKIKNFKKVFKNFAKFPAVRRMQFPVLCEWGVRWGSG